MSVDYVRAISLGFPDVGCHVFGDPSIYENLVWDNGAPLPSKEVVDAWISANSKFQQPQIKISKYEFRKLFTLNERIAIDNAAGNENISENNRAVLRTIFKDLELSEVVEMYNPDVISGVNFLEQLGLIAAGRAEQILANQSPE